MANYREVSDETKSLFYDVLDNATSIPQWVEFKLLANDDLKEMYQVRKLSDLFEYLADGTNIAVVINEEIFDELGDVGIQKRVIEEALGGVTVDENDKIKLQTFDFTTYSGFLEKYGADDVILMKLSIQSLFDQKKEREEEEKARAREEKKKNRKN